MDAPTLLLFLIKATIVLLGGAALAATLRRAPAGLRHLVWVATLGGVVALPALLRIAPAPIEVLPARVLTLPLAAEAAAPVARATEVRPQPAPVPAAAVPEAPPVPAPRAAFFAPTLAQALIGGWAVG